MEYQEVYGKFDPDTGAFGDTIEAINAAAAEGWRVHTAFVDHGGDLIGALMERSTQ